VCGFTNRPASDELRFAISYERLDQAFNQWPLAACGHCGKRKARNRNANRKARAAPPEFLKQDMARESAQAQPAIFDWNPDGVVAETPCRA
jgi:hypothetical protein